MKIVAPIRQLDEIAALARAGADELYCGVTPREWAERFGGASANRRPGGNLPSLAALAEAADVSKPTLFRYLYGDREMRLGTAQRLEVLTGVPAGSWAQPPTEPFAPTRAPDAPASSPALPTDDAPDAA